MKASLKSPGIDAMLTALTGINRVGCIERGECVTCKVTGITEASFVDDVSLTEYTISGMCQACQNSLFPEDPFDISIDI